MPVRRSLEFRLPTRARSPRWPWALAAALHVPVILILLWAPAPPAVATRWLRSIVLGDAVRAVPLPYARSLRHAAVAARVSGPAPAVARSALVPSSVPSLPSVATLARAVPPAPVDTPPHGAPSIQPRYGDGRLWVQPLPESPRRIASELTGRSPAELADSAVAKMIQAYLDEMAKEHAESPPALPSWTTKIGGKTVGLDQKWIYLGPLKIPTALLALLPIKMQGNMSNYQFNQQLQQMRADLFEAARRAENYDEFKQAVKDLHQQKEREREFKRNQRTRPD